MNAHVKIEHESIVKITSKGQVFLSKALREKGGMVPGGSVGISANENGDLVMRKVDAGVESPEERSARIRAALEAATGIMDLDGMSTDEYMKWLRGDWEP
jgi:antitoxin PrlF